MSEVGPILRSVQSLVLHQYPGRPSELDTIVEGLSRSLGLVKELNHITILAAYSQSRILLVTDSYDSKYSTDSKYSFAPTETSNPAPKAHRLPTCYAHSRRDVIAGGGGGGSSSVE